MFQWAWWQWLLGLAGTLFVGALGSGIWEVVLKPVYAKIVQLTVWMVTFGYKSSRDSLYAEAAKGRNDRSVMLLLLIAIVFGIPYVVTSGIIKLDAAELRRYQDTLVSYNLTQQMHSTEEYEAMTKPERDAEDARLETAKRLESNNERLKLQEDAEKIRRALELYKRAWMINICAFAFPCFVLIRSARLMLINSIISDFNQRFAICRPFLTEANQWLINSRFAQMSTRAEYTKIMVDLKEAIKAANFQMPATLF